MDKELVPIVNDLTTGGPANVLSAEQGKILDTKLTELSGEISNVEGYAEELVNGLETEANNKFASVDSEIENLKRGEAYVMGETLAFRNYADAKIIGNTLTL